MLNGITGTVVESRSAQSLARAVLRALEDTDWGERAANEAAKFVAARFGYDRMISETLQVYAHQGWPGVQPVFDIAEETVSKSRYGH
jgi:glycosyltransferase involved in cell wall biosynthesis